MKNYYLVLKSDFDSLLPQEKREILTISNSSNINEFPVVTLSSKDFLIIETINNVTSESFLKTCDSFTKENLQKIINSGSYSHTANIYSNSAWVNVGQSLPFASKKMNGKSLYKRIHGISCDVEIGANEILFTVPYNLCKITGIEFLNGSHGDSCSLEVLDTATGLITGIPNQKLNQFGFSVYVAHGFYEHKSEYDADLYKDLQLKIIYTSIEDKNIAMNFILNELK